MERHEDHIVDAMRYALTAFKWKYDEFYENLPWYKKLWIRINKFFRNLV